MKTKALLAAAVLAFAPIASFAACTGEQHQAMSCADGMVFDSETNSCKTVTG